MPVVQFHVAQGTEEAAAGLAGDDCLALRVLEATGLECGGHRLAGPVEALNDKALVAAGWAKHVRDLTPSLSGDAPAAGDLMAPEETARLDETLKSLQAAWSRKALPQPEEAEAHFLAAQVYLQLASAKYGGVAAPKSAAAAAPAQTVVVQQAPRVAAAEPAGVRSGR